MNIIAIIKHCIFRFDSCCKMHDMMNQGIAISTGFPLSFLKCLTIRNQGFCVRSLIFKLLINTLALNYATIETLPAEKQFWKWYSEISEAGDYILNDGDGIANQDQRERVLEIEAACNSNVVELIIHFKKVMLMFGTFEAF